MKGESAWEFEIQGTVRSNKFSHFYGLKKPLFKSQHCLIRGKMPNMIFTSLKATNELPDYKFTVLTPYEDLKHNISIIRNKLFCFAVPSTVQQRVWKFYGFVRSLLKLHK